jgi:hypothetical protein
MEEQMTIIEAINGIDSLKPNTYTTEQKIEWLKRLDGLIKEQVIDTHEGGHDIEIGENYNESDTLLIVPAPYDELYIQYLAMKIDFANNEYRKYNNSASMYNQSLLEFKKWYNREHMPKSVPNMTY